MKKQQLRFKNNNIIWFIVGILFLPMFVKAEEESELWLNPYGITGMTHYQLEYGPGEEISGIKDNVKLSDNLPFLGAGITGIYRGVSVDASFVTSSGLLGDIEQSGEYSDPNLKNIFYDRDIHLKRRTWNASLGYELLSNNSENLVIFAGYKQAKTNYGWVDHEYKTRNRNSAVIGIPSKDNEFNTDGWFLGINYSREVDIFWGHKGRLGLNFSYAWLDGELETRRTHKEIEGGLRSRTRYENVLSKTRGRTIGINWAAGLPFLGEDWSYSIFLEHSDYGFEAKSGYFTDTFFSDGYTHEILDLNSYDAKETIYSINFSVSYFFD